ncbi:MAG TPA: hypothetical protein VMT20_15250 [Terriglobia bacterium]|nr:hypothetical protein [Terriglobia bacterium]
MIRKFLRALSAALFLAAPISASAGNPPVWSAAGVSGGFAPLNGTAAGTLGFTSATPYAFTTSQAQSSATLNELAVANSTNLQAGQTVVGTGLPAATVISSIAGSGENVENANGSFLAGQPTIPLSNTVKLVTGMQCTDATNTSAVPAGSIITSLSPGVSITLSNNLTQNSSGASDSIICDPVLTLSNSATSPLSAGATLSIYDNATISSGNIGTTGTISIGGTVVLATPYPGAPTQGGPVLVGPGAGAGIGPNSAGTTFVGNSAGAADSSGVENTGVGWHSMNLLTTGNYNTALGINSMGHDVHGSNNVAIGEDSQRNTTSSTWNVSIGPNAMYSGTSTARNIAIGQNALNGQTSSAEVDNIAEGYYSMSSGSLTTAYQNIGLGSYSFNALTSGYNNIGIGYQAEYSQLTGYDNVAIGTGAGYGGTNTDYDIFIGHNVGLNITGNGNIALGGYAMSGGSGSAGGNIAIGYKAGQFVAGSAGLNNVMIGFQVGYTTLQGGGNNILIGTSGSVDAQTSSQNYGVDIGNVITGYQQGATNPNLCVIGSPCILGVRRGANLNSTADQAITVAPLTSGQAGYMPTASKYIVTGVWVDNCSAASGTAAGGIYTAASKGGTTLVAASQTYGNCSSATTMQTATLAAAAASNTLTASTLYLSLTTAQGSADTGDVYVYGVPFN